MPYRHLLLSEMVWTGGSTGDNVTILVLLFVLLGGVGLVLYLVKQSLARNDFLNPTDDTEGESIHSYSGAMSKVVFGMVGFLLLYGFLSMLG
jgi:hypothetical protein